MSNSLSGETHEHEWLEADKSTATCTEDGVITYICVDCGQSREFVYKKALGHNEVIDEAKEATCTKTGLTEGKHCDRCNEVLVQQEEISSLGHSFADWTIVKEATCESQGTKRRDCINCDHYEEETIDAKEHNYESVVTKPTCVEQGYETFTCTNCNHSYVGNYVDALEHDYQVSVHKDATCLEDGYTTYVCSYNSTHTYTNVLEALGHSEVIDVAVEPTCTETGLTEGKHCEVCKEVLIKQEVVDSKGHEWSYICGECGQINESYYTDGLELTLSSDESYYSVTGIRTSTDVYIFIPSTYNGLPVTSIGDSAFSRCRSLKSITIPNSVTSIGDSAFRYCSSLTNIVIPGSVTSIGDSAFCGCDSLKSITIPDSVTIISNGAFAGCSSLTSITIPDSVTSIGYRAFRDCISLTSVTIGNSVTSIGYGAFWGCSSLESITIPDSVTSIGDSTFEGCSSLTNIVIPDSVTSIGDSTF
ncbi:MAG: leucine-rich repeat domain-containing protein, partial [Bacilli bacterium]|nr:leucine-rich repeat domain-containing protein [Bacilli bacterium]